MLLEGERLVREAGRAGGLGRYQLEAAIQAVHADRRRTGQTAWWVIAHLYVGLVRLSPRIGARIGQAVAVARADEPAKALALLDRSGINSSRPAGMALPPFWTARAGHSVEWLRGPAGRRRRCRRGDARSQPGGSTLIELPSRP
jgi:RNA polymerase sigma-70 factor (ECF subfamily)